MSGAKLGIAGDGQLGRMVALAAHALGVRPVILGQPDSPAAQVADLVVGDYGNIEDVRDFCSQNAVTTFEFEDVSPEGLLLAAEAGAAIYPDPAILQQIRDKFRQKSWLEEAGLPVGEFAEVTSVEQAQALADSWGYPVVLKARYGSYDGYGNAVIHYSSQLEAAYSRLSAKSGLYLERWMPFTQELAVVVVRDRQGNIEHYPAVQTIQRKNVCQMVIADQRFSDQLPYQKAVLLARHIIQALDYVGVLAVEMFLLEDGQVLINELAPRVHNSGHWTIEGARTSQFENHVRAVMGWPLGRCDLISPAVVTVNILGEVDSQPLDGPPDGYEEALAFGGVSIHWYGKALAKLGRKLGHITTVGNDVAEAARLVEDARACLRV